MLDVHKLTTFQRPVSWILWSRKSETAIVIIPEEAEIILTMLRSGLVAAEVYLLTYAAPTTRKMIAFYSMSFHNLSPTSQEVMLPTWLRVQVFLLAGGLYFNWNDHQALCDFLGIQAAGTVTTEDVPDLHNMQDANEDDVDECRLDSPRSPTRAVWPFTARPLTFLQEWLSVRRRGQDFAHSPMGFIAQGKPLQGSHPFFCESDTAPTTTDNYSKKDKAAELESPSDMSCSVSDTNCSGHDSHSFSSDSPLNGSTSG